jgi:hypothetical protein
MSKISCYLRLHEVPLHLYQITAGFLLLKRQGIIDLKIEKFNKNSKDKLPYNMMEVIVNNEIRVLYDLNDGYDNLLSRNQNYVDFMNGLLSNYHFCFKRSFNSEYNSKLKEGKKIFPLGLNYMVTVPRNISHYPFLHDPKIEKYKKLFRMLPLSEYYNGLYYVDSFEDIPRKERDPKILFMARLWDINADNGYELSSQKKEERRFINQQRAQCIRLCKQEFGDKFFGGISPSKFSNEYYPDLIIKDKSLTKRNNYIEKLKESSICIATMGLHESIGWKFGEYIAASKAIVTEELRYELPGNLENEKNYLVFRNPQECVDQIYRLLNDENLRYKIMVNNLQYYHQFVRPDKLVLNSLLIVLSNGGIEVESNFNRVYAYI